MKFGFAILLKSLVIAFVAALAAWFYVFFISHFLEFDGLEPSDNQEDWIRALSFALFGSYCVGLPVALLTYFLAGGHLRQSPLTLFMIALLAAIMMLLASMVFGDSFIVAMFGLPAAIAAFVFAGLGWLWIVKPQRGHAQ